MQLPLRGLCGFKNGNHKEKIESRLMQFPLLYGFKNINQKEQKEIEETPESFYFSNQEFEKSYKGYRKFF
jgi:hypothetical protein